MQTIRLSKAIEGDGLAEGDTITVDELSAAKLIERGDATAIDDETDATGAPAERVETIDDIVDPGVARNRRQMAVNVVGGDARPVYRAPADAPVTPDADTTTSASASGTTTASTTRANRRGGSTSELAASDAQSAGGDAGGGTS